MPTYVPFHRDQAFLLPPDLKAWLPADDLAHFVGAAVERVPLGAFAVATRPGGKPHYHPRLMLALLIDSYATGLSSRRIERATYGDIAVRFVAATLHPGHDTIAVFRRASTAAFEAAFLHVLLLAREAGLLLKTWPGAKGSAPSSMLPASGWKPKRALKPRLPVRLMRRRRPPMTPRKGVAAVRRNRPTMPRRLIGNAT